MTGNLLTLLNPYGLLAGLATLTLFTLHGAIFLTLKTTGDLRARSRVAALRVAAATVPLAAAFLLASQIAHGRLATDITAALAAVALLAAVAAALRGREGWAFAGTAVTLVLAVATLFGDLWPNVLPSTTSAAYSLTVHNASSSHYTLLVMTWVAVIFTPVVLAYQTWTYWVFRSRVSGTPLPSPLSGLGGLGGSGGSPSGGTGPAPAGGLGGPVTQVPSGP
jgi:cytochrome d ubiquinol oxidase subunit II